MNTACHSDLNGMAVDQWETCVFYHLQKKWLRMAVHFHADQNQQRGRLLSVIKMNSVAVHHDDAQTIRAPYH